MIQTHPRLDRRDVKKFVPGLYPAVNALGDAVDATDLERDLVELVKLRVSQINGCAYCVQYHTQHGRELDIPPEKLTLVVAWEETGIFSAREEAALAWAETLTLIAETHVPDAAWEAVRGVFSDADVAGLTAAVIAINALNRIAVTFRYAPEL